MNHELSPLHLLGALFGPGIIEELTSPPQPQARHPKSPNHAEGFDEGLIEGLCRTIDVIESFPELTLADLHEVLVDIRDELVDENADEDEGDTDPILALLQSVFGPNVQIISLEQTAR